MSIKEQAKQHFIKSLEIYFDDKFNDFTIKRLNRMLDEFNESIPSKFMKDKESYDMGYKEGYKDSKRYYTKQLNNDNNISSVLL